MRQAQPSLLTNVSKLLRIQYNKILDEPLPQRWVDLMRHLNEKDAAAQDGASNTSRGVES